MKLFGWRKIFIVVAAELFVCVFSPASCTVSIHGYSFFLHSQTDLPLSGLCHLQLVGISHPDRHSDTQSSAVNDHNDKKV